MSEELDVNNQNGKNDDDQVENINISKGIDASTNLYELPLGDALTIEQTYPITATQKTHFVVLAGPSDSGKTTFVTTLYQMFQEGPVGDFFFAGSQTLQGFEKRSFPTRTDSEGSIPQVPKTRRGMYDSILHLDLWESSKNMTHHFLISDFSGEDYDSAVADVEVMKNDFGILRSADIIVALIDGDLISQKKFRNGVVQNVIELLQTINDANLIRQNTRIYIVLSKYDIISMHCEKESSVKDFIKEIEIRFRSKFNTIFEEMRFFKVAAMPETNLEFKMGCGLEELLVSWVNCKPSLTYNSEPSTYSFQSEFNKFKKRILETKI